MSTQTWQWQDGDHWFAYPPDIQQMISEASSAGIKNFEVQFDGVVYVIDLVEKWQAPAEHLERRQSIRLADAHASDVASPSQPLVPQAQGKIAAYSQQIVSGLDRAAGFAEKKIGSYAEGKLRSSPREGPEQPVNPRTKSAVAVGEKTVGAVRGVSSSVATAVEYVGQKVGGALGSHVNPDGTIAQLVSAYSKVSEAATENVKRVVNVASEKHVEVVHHDYGPEHAEVSKSLGNMGKGLVGVAVDVHDVVHPIKSIAKGAATEACRSRSSAELEAPSDDQPVVRAQTQ
eukprot:NODE_2612_length_1156_cov_51.000903_g2390_i0.p1 GENE.NODE_2612_length_1156_cov_51.000903_g2390_i0~~NODE_2612_length_1156_cov_51.000903_g2390_i0.p1  ORF type:complete len:288 (+),score=54.33 NODE_2612_length_1156_cov_51.000903_g2390_i0:68-931(+)